MSLERAISAIPGVRFGAVARHADARGSFRELWRAPEPGAGEPADPTAAPRFVQANLSTSAVGVLRGLHLHRRQLDYWIVVAGRAFVAVVDVRPVLADPTAAPTIETRVLGADEWVVIPAGVAHGFLALEPLELMYLVTNWYDGSDELGFAWDDPEIGVPWPPMPGDAPGVAASRPIVSDRDASNPPLAELVARIQAAS